MSISKNMKRSLLSAIAGTMMITSVVTPVEAQESLSTITSNTETSTTTTQQSSSKSTSSSTQRSSSAKSATSSQKKNLL